MQFPLEPLKNVTLTDSLCANALRLEVDYLNAIEPGRLLAGFYENAGLKTPFLRYGGWENKLIGGHTAGHYLTALSQAVANAGVAEEDREKLRKKLTGFVDALALCQTHSKGKAGFLWAAPPVEGGAEAQFDNVERGRTNIKREAWVPWYTMHKILAGLIDAYRLAGLEQALETASRLGDWVAERVQRWDARTRRRVLSVEYGGMNDCLYSLYAFTGKAEHARAAHLFDEEKLFDEILDSAPDALDGKHSNTTIPKVLGALNRYFVMHGRVFDGKKVDATRYLRVAERFFGMVSERHSYVTGGASEWERFGRDYVLDAERTNCNCETCISYNMLKLARGLFTVTGESRYADYYDNTFTNAILASQDPKTGMTTYFQPMAGGFFKVFSTPYDSFWCCTGSGMENFTKLGDSAFYRGGDRIYIEQYLAANAQTEGVSFALDCDFPSRDRGTLRLLRAERETVFCFRVPDWAADAPRFALNGARPAFREEDGHIAVAMKEGDELAFRIPVEVTLKGLPDGDALAFRFGGTALAARLGTEDMQEAETGVDVRIPARKYGSDRVFFEDLEDVLAAPSAYLVREGEEFRLRGTDRELLFRPYNRLSGERYALYLRLSEYGWENGKPVKREEGETRVPLDTVQAGYGQYEEDALHALSEVRSVGATADGASRYAKQGGYFCYDLAVDPQKRCTLAFTLRRADNGKTLKITVGGEKVFEETLLYTMGEAFYPREIALDNALLARTARKKQVNGEEKTVVSVRFEGSRGRASAHICGFIKIYAE